MKLLIIFAISAVLLQYHFAPGHPLFDEYDSSSDQESPIKTVLPVELSKHYQLLGKSFNLGTFSVVEKAQIKNTKIKVAIKITNKKKTKDPELKEGLEKIIERARKEAEILINLPRHPNIVQFKELIETKEDIYLVMEYVSGVTVHEYLGGKKLDEDTARVIFKPVVEALKHCHDNGIVHRDLKTENVIIDGSNNHIKLIDFGFATNLTGGVLLDGYLCAKIFAAPEAIDSEKSGSKYDGFKSDIWQLGAFLYELVCGSLIKRASLGKEKLLFPPELRLTKGVKDLLLNILEIDPDKRFTLDEIMKHDWMKTRGSNTQSG